jgi:hypothetical protein
MEDLPLPELGDASLKRKILIRSKRGAEHMICGAHIRQAEIYQGNTRKLEQT